MGTDDQNESEQAENWNIEGLSINLEERLSGGLRLDGYGMWVFNWEMKIRDLKKWIGGWDWLEFSGNGSGLIFVY